MELTTALIYYAVFLIINFFLFKLTQRIEYKKQGTVDTNPFSVLILLMAFMGTLIFLLIILIDSGVMDYKPKNK